MDPIAARSPSTWFALLEVAIREGRPRDAGIARRRLAALGVTVRLDSRGTMVREVRRSRGSGRSR